MKIKHLFLIVLLFVTGMVSAQQMGPIPVNKNVRQGKLSNGLTYYILHNEWPEHVANFYIAQRVGSSTVSATCRRPVRAHSTPAC